MSIKPQFETYRYVGEICRLQSQSLVECRLSGSEISEVLAVQAKAVPTETVCADGEARYSGKLFIGIIYEDGEKKICRAERGVEFFHKAEGEEIAPACFCKTHFKTENITWRREGSGLYISVVVDACIDVYGSRQMEYLSGGDNVIAKQELTEVYKTVCVSGETDGEDEFETDYVGDILLHSESAVANRVTADNGQIEIEGEIALNICVLKQDASVCAYERLIPFSMQIPCEEAFGNLTAGARIDVKSAQLSVATDEEQGNSKIVLSYCLSAECSLCFKEELLLAVDAFSPTAETTLSFANEGGRYLMKQEKCTERVGGTAVLSTGIDGEYTLLASVLPKVELCARKGENGMEMEGVIFADVLLLLADGTHKSAKLSMPVVFPIACEGEYAEADGMVCGLNVRRKKNGETEAEAVLKMSVRSYADKAWSYVSEVAEGKELPPTNSAFSVFMTQAGEELWEVAKRLKTSPEALQKGNPDLEFPLQDGQRIYVYRQIQ